MLWAVMVAFSQKKMASLTLLSIMLPIGLLATFRVIGVVREPPKTETFTVETVAWNMIRPSQISVLGNTASNSYADVKASVDFKVNVVGYRENWDFFWFDDVDVVDLRILASSSVTDGYITRMNVKFSGIDDLADLSIERADESMELRHLEVNRISEGSSEASFETTSVQKPQTGSLSILTFWVFSDTNSKDHWATITLEVTFFTEGMFKEMRIPLLLGILAK